MREEIYNKMIEKAGKVKDKHGKKVKKFLEDNRDDLKHLSDEVLARAAGMVGLGEKDRAISYLSYLSMSPNELIDDVHSSADEIRRIHSEAMERVERWNSALKTLGLEASKTLAAIALAAL